ncbi:MAG: lysoplasmalogenase [Bacteroidales bacterium]|nr:lysoplasmalogenase [Bacteroidales bacterium]
MTKRLPLLFFIVACLVNLAGRLWNPELAGIVKPALMPLLAATVLSAAVEGGVNRNQLFLLIAAELFGCLGDTFLLSSEFVFFAAGIGSFLIGHIFYITLFGRQSLKGINPMGWILSLVVMSGLVYGLVRLLKVEGALLAPMAVYGFMLMLLIFSALCGLIRFRQKVTWTLLFLGALLFTFSDCLIAAGTFGVIDFELREFVIMATYLLAQSLLAIGGLRLCRKK